VSLLKYLISLGFPLFGGGPQTIPRAATRGAAKIGSTAVLDYLVAMGWDVNEDRYDAIML